MAQTIRSFVSSTRLWHRLFRGGASLAFHALVVGAALLVVDFFWPGSYGTAIWFGLTWLVLVLAFQVLRRGASLHTADRTLGLRDQLVTWWEVRGERDDPVAQWLEEDLERAIDRLPPASRSPLWRRQARRLWWLLPALLLVWWIGPLGRNLGMHSETGDTREASAGAPRGSDGSSGAGSSGGASKPAPGDRPKSPRPSKPSSARQSPERRNDPSDNKSIPPVPPRKIPKLPAVDEFIIPRFLGEGDGVKKRMKVAVVEQGDAPRANTRRQQSTSAVAQEDRQPEFQAAAERALRDRHVPRSERSFVKRYFEALLGERR